MEDIRRLLFTLPSTTLSAMAKKYEEKVPAPMNRQFPERLGKEEAIKNKQTRKRARTELFPSGRDVNINNIFVKVKLSLSGTSPPIRFFVIIILVLIYCYYYFIFLI